MPIGQDILGRPRIIIKSGIQYKLCSCTISDVIKETIKDFLIQLQSKLTPEQNFNFKMIEISKT